MWVSQPFAALPSQSAVWPVMQAGAAPSPPALSDGAPSLRAPHEPPSHSTPGATSSDDPHDACTATADTTTETTAAPPMLP
jgi:hypothetical protein